MVFEIKGLYSRSAQIRLIQEKPIVPYPTPALPGSGALETQKAASTGSDEAMVSDVGTDALAAPQDACACACAKRTDKGGIITRRFSALLALARPRDRAGHATPVHAPPSGDAVSGEPARAPRRERQPRALRRCGKV